LPLPNDLTGQALGIAENQGSGTVTPGAAGNSFSFSTYDVASDFYNGSGNFNNYYWETVPQEPVHYTLYAITPINTPHEPSCPTSANNGTPIFVPRFAALSHAELQTQFSQSKLTYHNLNTAYHALIDSGSTAGMLAFLDSNNTSANITAVRQKLLNASPYLSETVLEKAAQTEGSVPDSLMLTVFTSQPRWYGKKQVNRLVTKTKQPYAAK
jgi:hypothetical protein